MSSDEEIERAILTQKRWADLDNRMRDLIGGSQEYDKKILQYSIENQLRYRGNLVRFVVNNEYEYYRELLKYSRDHLMLFPYHLSDFIITGMRITPFQYYLATLSQLLEQEKSYDTLPNFTAADCLKLLGIGRNQYIDIMNELRSTYRSFLGVGVFKRNPRDLLPKKPVTDVPIEPWWLVNAGYITEDDVRSMVTTPERTIIDRLFTQDGLSNQIVACDLDGKHVRSLYLKGLIYLDVPIYDDDFIVVPPLEGFVMNRVTGDYFETLLYKIFVSVDQNTTVQELAKILEIDIRLVKNAISMYCRLGFAYKKNLYIDMKRCHPSWREHLQKYQDLGINVVQQHSPLTHTSKHLANFITELASIDADHDRGIEVTDATQITDLTPAQNQQLVQSPSIILSANQPSPLSQSSVAKKIALFYDSNLAAFLMMGNLSAKLKNHAVTMYEVGKLSDEWIDSLLEELSKIQTSSLEDDGFEARRYYVHALMLHRTIEFIRSDLKLASNLFKSVKNVDSVDQTGLRVGLDLIRVESLSNLDVESSERFLKKNYHLIISVAPLNQDVKLNSATSLPHLGPGSPLINSLWFRLYIYYVTGHGPPSLLLLQGYRLTKLPEPFHKSNTLLINHWHRDPTFVSPQNAIEVINDALTNSPVLLQAYPINPVGGNLISSEEKVFVPLPLSNKPDVEDQDTDASRQFDGGASHLERTPVVLSLSKQLNLKRICGYITLLRTTESALKMIDQANGTFSLSDSEPAGQQVGGGTEVIKDLDHDQEEEFILFDCHFGVPLFDRSLNKQVRNKISSQSLCDPSSLDELTEFTRDLNSRIDHFVKKYQSKSDQTSIDSSNCGDQRHFFHFPKQFECSVPRPAQNLLFVNGKLSIFGEDG